ncbi:porphobilinogen deaminase [archaeon]|nr:porphobilinogen deaminase [archaeon]
MKLKVGTRRSRLALWQTDYIIGMLKYRFPELEFDREIIRTTGDKIKDAPLAKIGGKGIFVKEIDEAVRDGKVEIAVHSMKDVPTELLPELHIAATPTREEVADALISASEEKIEDLPEGSVIGTGSIRRIAEVKSYRKDLEIKDLRGNVDTRLRKMKAGKYNAIIMAAAGLKRLGFENEITQRLPEDIFIPSISQGAIAVVARRDSEVNEYLKAINHSHSMARVLAERSLLIEMGGGCQIPLGAFSKIEGDKLEIIATVISPDGSERIDVKTEGELSRPEDLGRELAEKLRAKGAEKIIQEIQLITTN